MTNNYNTTTYSGGLEALAFNPNGMFSTDDSDNPSSVLQAIR